MQMEGCSVVGGRVSLGLRQGSGQEVQFSPGGRVSLSSVLIEARKMGRR